MFLFLKFLINRTHEIYNFFLFITSIILIASCSSTPPNNQGNICKIFAQHPGWFNDAKKIRKKWGTSISILMAFVKQESSYRKMQDRPLDGLPLYPRTPDERKGLCASTRPRVERIQGRKRKIFKKSFRI